MKKIKLTVILIVFAVLIIFAFQNIPPTPITFLIYTFKISTALLTLVSALIGFLVGIIFMLFLNRKKI